MQSVRLTAGDAAPISLRRCVEASEASPGPEAELLLCCGRSCMDAANAARIRALLNEELDWDRLVGLARRHGMLPLLYRSLEASDPEAVPLPTMAELREAFHANAARNLALTGELLRFLKQFETDGIPALPFKGPVLAAA